MILAATIATAWVGVGIAVAIALGKAVVIADSRTTH
jgi:hypothetical protein